MFQIIGFIKTCRLFVQARHYARIMPCLLVVCDPHPRQENETSPILLKAASRLLHPSATGYFSVRVVGKYCLIHFCTCLSSFLVCNKIGLTRQTLCFQRFYWLVLL